MELARPDPQLSDGTIGLEPLGRAHLDDLEDLAQDPDVARHTYVRVPFAGDDAVLWLGRYIQGWRDGSAAGFAIVDPDGAFLGFCALVRIDRDGAQAEIGYITSPAARGQGIATRALDLISAWALDEVGLKRLELRIGDDNPGSVRVAERSGFSHEGLLRSVHLKQGRRVDIHVYARIAI